MAILFNLVCEDALHEYNLLTDTLRLVEGSRQKTISNGSVSETMDLISVVGSTDRNIILAENEITETGDLARKWVLDRTVGYAVWLEEQANLETKRRSLVTNVELMQMEGAYTSKLLGRKGVSLWRLYIEHSEWWEPSAVETLSQATISCWGGKWTISPSTYLRGTIDGRISKATIQPTSGSTENGEFWFGIRQPREIDAVSEFQPIWELENSTLYSADTTVTSESGASPQGSSSNNRLTCSFSTTAAMVLRAGIRVSQAWTGGSLYYQHMLGRYLVLLRAKVDTATVARIRPYAGFEGSMRPYPEIDISNTTYQLIPIGEVTIPATGNRTELGILGRYAVANNAIKLFAQRTSGSGSLYLDALCFIPTDYMIYANIYPNATDQVRVIWYTFADGGRQAIRANLSDTPDGNGEFYMPNWWMPRGGGVGVLAAQNPTGVLHSMTNTATVTLLKYARFLNFSPYA